MVFDCVLVVQVIERDDWEVFDVIPGCDDDNLGINLLSPREC